MIFDERWRAECHAKRENERLSTVFEPAMKAAKKKNDQREVEQLSADYSLARRLNNGPEIIRTARLVKRARNLGIILPPLPDWKAPNFHDNENWLFNIMKGGYVLTDAAEFELRQKVRKEENERLDHKMRYISRVVILVIGLLGAVTGLVGTLLGFYLVIHHPSK
jgi:hypothetical protein